MEIGAELLHQSRVEPAGLKKRVEQ